MVARDVYNWKYLSGGSSSAIRLDGNNREDRGIHKPDNAASWFANTSQLRLERSPKKKFKKIDRKKMEFDNTTDAPLRPTGRCNFLWPVGLNSH